MTPPHTRLTCRAPNRFSPAIVLWQHFVGFDRPFLHHQRLSSIAAEPAQQGAIRHHGDNGLLNPQEPSGLTRIQAGTAREEGARPGGPKLNIRRVEAAGTWHATKAKASVLKNVQQQYDARKASLTATETLLAKARAAFEDAKDYVGVIVQPMVSPTPCKESNLPWCLPKEGRTMTGIDRLGVEIARFYDFSRPDYHEALARRQLIEQVRNHVRQTLPDHILEVFGSESTGLALATSDIDFRLLQQQRLEDPALARLPPTPKQRAKAMKDLHNLRWNGLARHKAYMLPKLRYARYPLISLQDRQSGLDVQIVLSNDTSLSREIMKGYMAQYPYLCQLYFVVKTMFDVRGLSDVFRGGFGSYSLFMMIVASIRHNPHPRKDAAGGLINFLKFYRSFRTEKLGISIEPVWLFDKSDQPVITDTVKHKLEEGTAKPLPPYMLCLRDPADETNDLGRKAIAIKHVQATFKKICFELDRDMTVNTRASLLSPLVGSSYMLNKERRGKLRHYGARLSIQLKKNLAAKAKMVRDREEMEEVDKESEDENERARLAREARDKEWQRLTDERNESLRLEAERTAVLEHGDAMASILGMPFVEDDTSTAIKQEAERPPIKYTSGEENAEPNVETRGQRIAYFPAKEACLEAEKRSIDSTLAEQRKDSQEA